MTSTSKGRSAGRNGSIVLALIALIGVMALIPLAIRTLLFQPFVIPSASMEPNLFEGDYVIVSKYSYGYSRHSIPFSPNLFPGRIFFRPPTRGDIVVFKLPRDGRTDYIKRLIGLPGDRIQLKQGLVYVNGEAVRRTPAAPGTQDMGYGEQRPVDRYLETLSNGRRILVNSYGDDGQAENTGVYVVPPHCYFVLGDNRDDSLDSRFRPGETAARGDASCPWTGSLGALDAVAGVGFVPEENLEGRARMVLFSLKARQHPDRFAVALN